jgi:hypothetical protein
MDINDPRRRLQVLNQSNPSIRIATAPQPQPQIRINSGPVKTPDIYVAGSNTPVQAAQSSNNSWNTPTTPQPSRFGGFFKTIGNIGKGVAKPFVNTGADVSNAIGNAEIGIAHTFGLANDVKTQTNEQQFGKTLAGVPIESNTPRHFLTNAGQVALTVAAPELKAATLPGQVALDAGIGAGYGGLEGVGNQDSLRSTLKQTAIGGALGGIFAPVAKGISKVFGKGSGDVAEQIANESSAAKLVKKYGIPEDASGYLAKESNPETIRAVLDQMATNGVPIKDWVPSKTSSDNSTATDLAPGMFDATNPPQSALPNGMHAPGAADPVEVLSKQATTAKTASEFADYYKGLSGEEKAVADSALDGKTPEEFFNAVHGQADTVLHLPDKGVHAKLTPEQAAVLADETKHIPFTAEDRPHLTAGPEVLKRTQEITQEDLAAMSPNAKAALANAQKEIDAAGAKAKPSGEPVGDLPPEDVAAIKAAGGVVPESGSAASAVKGDISPETATPSEVSAKPTEVATSQNASPAVDQVLGKLDEASQSYNPEAKTFSKQRGAALYRGADAAQAEGGLAGHYEQLKALKGIKKQTGFQPIQVEPAVRDEVMSAIHNSSLMPGEKLSANTGMLKVFGHIDGAPTPSEIKLIRSALGNDVADSIEQNMQLAGMTGREKLAMVAATPKAAMATADISAPLRQGGVLGSRFPKQFAENTAEAVKFFGSPQHFQEAMSEIKARPNFETYQKMGLHVDAAESVTGTEEALMSSILQTDTAKKLLVGHVTSASDRAYSGFLTKFRADVADKILGDLKTGDVQLDDKALQSLGKFINTASGRGDLGQLERHAGLLSKALFSPRLWKSRLDLLNPIYYARLSGPAQKYAIQTSASFASVAGTVLSLAALAGATVVWDPRSADFAKIKVGNTRYDILGGLQQNIRLGAQMWTGEKIDSTTGEIQTLGPDRGFGKPSRKDLLYQFFENKENPLLGYAGKVLEGTDPTGQPINKTTEAAKLFIPLNAQDIYATAQDKGSVGKGVAMGAPGIFGVGVQTYGNVKSKDKGSNGEFAGKQTPDMVTGLDGKVLLNDKGAPVKVKFDPNSTPLEQKAQLDAARQTALRADYVKSLPKEDQRLMKLDDSQLKQYVKDGTIDQARFDHIKNIQKTAESQSNGNQYKVKDGATSPLAVQTFQKLNSMDKKDQDYWLSDKNPPDDASKQITTLLNKERSDGLSEFKPSNALAKAYADYES